MLDQNHTQISVIVELRKNGIFYIVLLLRNPLGCEDYEVRYDLPLITILPYEDVYLRLRTELSDITGLNIPVIEGEGELNYYQARGHRVMTYRSFCSVHSLDNRSGKPCHIEVLRCKADGSTEKIENSPETLVLMKLDEVAFIVQDAPERFNPYIVSAIKKYLKATGHIVKSSKNF